MAASAVRVPRVLDKYMLPKVAFTVITGASMAGAALTGLRHGVESWPFLAMRWAAVWVMALLLGSQVWKIFYLRPAVAMRPVAGAVDYADAMLKLHVRWQKALLPFAVLLVGGDLAFYSTRGAVAVPWLSAAGVALVVAMAGLGLTWTTRQDAQKQDLATWLTLAGLAGTVAALAGLDVALQPAGASRWLLAPNRMLHLWAFSAWLGGALWNIFIAVPAGMTRVNMDTVILANFQLERFRVVVRTVFPVIVATGLVQAWAMFGWNWQALFTNTWGYLVLTKLGLILVLIGVFIACPMWRACSPIRGVCNLDDL
jgi:putative copper resistance protein D